MLGVMRFSVSHLLFVFASVHFPCSAKTFPFPGNKPEPLDLHALIGANICISPGKFENNATLIVKDGFIQKVGKDLRIPPGYREWDCRGQTIYPGFIEPYFLGTAENAKLLDLGHEIQLSATSSSAFHGLPSTTKDNGRKGLGFGIQGVCPEKRVVDDFQPEAAVWNDFRKNGFTALHLVPHEGIFRGTGTLVLLEDKDPSNAILRNEVSQILAFDPIGKKQSPSVYPNSLMGVLSVVRQTLHEIQFAEKQSRYEGRNSKETRLYDPHPGILSLSRSIQKRNGLPIWCEPGSCLTTNTAIALFEEFSLAPAVLISSGEDWRRPDLSISAKHHYVLPLNFSKVPNLPDSEDWDQISLDQLRAWDHAPSLPSLMAKGTNSLSFTTMGCEFKEFRKNLIDSIARGLSEADALAALTVNPAKICGIEEICGTLEEGKLANFLIVEGDSYFDERFPLHSTWIRGVPWLHHPEPLKNDSNLTIRTSQKRIAKYPKDERGSWEVSNNLLFRNFKVWTGDKAGVLENHDLWVRNGVIRAIGKTLKISDHHDLQVVDGNGRHLTPGIIDCHSHAMILGGVNESTLPSTAMVRISDVVNSESINIERQLAGGVTVCNLLHGSANPIGGQNAVIKLRLGASPQKMIMRRAPAGIKFALGENVKQANWGDEYKTRFPQSRMGVKTFFENRFNAALAYEKDLEKEREGGPPVRRNLELQAILEVIRGERLIHCHSYRQDEILVFLRTMEKFAVRVASLQHALEGYKVADEIAGHGAGPSAFSDWWAYKFEVYDAIPYAGALMHGRGCVVSFNSDSPDHARRMNLEAAKAVKYGSLSEPEALDFVTINPARQLGIDQWVGSIEVGKDADFAIWSGNPLDYRTRCHQTWIDGKPYFDLSRSQKLDLARSEERKALIERAKTENQKNKTRESTRRAREKFFRASLESACDLHPHSCRTHDCSRTEVVR